MKIAMKLSLSCTVLVLFLSPLFVGGNYNLTVGTTYTYDVLSSNWTLNLGTESAFGVGFNFQGSNFPVKTQFAVQVNALYANSIEWTITIGTNNESNSNTPFDDIATIHDLIIYPLILTLGIYTEWNQTTLELGPPIFQLFFIEPVTCSLLFLNLTNTTYVEDIFSDFGWNFDIINGFFENSTSTATFDWIMKGSYFDSPSDTNYSGIYRWKIAFEKTTGVVKGLKMEFDFAGKIEGLIFRLKHKQHYEHIGFNLPQYYFGGLIFPGFKWFIVLPVLFSFGGIALYIRKRKRVAFLN